jgi:transposase-like protein
MASKNTNARQLRCPHCLSERTVHWGAAYGVPRYRCKACEHTFNILTNTPLARLRYKKRWLTYVGTMVERKSVRKSAVACGVSATTSFRWHQRFLDCSADQRVRILGAIASTYSNAPALTGLSENASAAELSWCKELLPVILSWIL